MNATKNDVTILVNTCDAYSDVLKLFFSALQEYWKQCPFDVVINTEKNSYERYPAKTHNYFAHDGKDRWGERLISTLESIKTDYVLVLYDDFILEDIINDEAIDKAFVRLKNNDGASVIYLVEVNLKSHSINGVDEYVMIDEFADFRLNSSPAIWRKKDLLSYTGEYDNPWAWEVFGSYRTFGNRKAFYAVKSKEHNIYKYNYEKGGAIYRGKWVRAVVEEKIFRYQLDIDLNERGFSEENIFEKRNLKWKINFLMLGYKMIGLKFLMFFPRYIRAKLHVK